MISRADVVEAQAAWGAGIVHIGSADSWALARTRAKEFIEAQYLLDGTLLFCPTKAAQQQFRPNLESALSYFVGRNDQYAEDGGFALEPWTKVRFENAGIVELADSAVAMGNYFFTNTGGQDTKVEYTFVYVRNGDGQVRIQTHHSALPYPG